MKKLSLSLLALLATVGSSYAASIKWAAGFDSAMLRAKSAHKLVMVDFYTDWCVWCKKLDKDTYVSAPVVAKSEGFVAVKVNAEKEGIAQAKKYNVHAFPTILFLKPNGEVAWKIEGYMPAEEFAKQMQMAEGVDTELPKLEATFKTSGGNPELDSKLVAYYGGQGSLDKVKSVLNSLDKLNIAGPSSEVGAAYNAGGDAYQTANKFPEAIAYFRKAEMIGKPAQIAYARISLAECYLGANDTTSAVPVLQALVKMGPEADSYRNQAQAILDQLDKKKPSKP